MKKLLLITFFICSFLQAQDLAYITNLKNVSSETEAINISNEIASLSNIKLRLLKSEEIKDQNIFAVRYVPEELTNVQYDALDVSEQNNFLTVSFAYLIDGENKALEMSGTKKLNFRSVTGKYLQIFGFWNKYFKPDADKEALLTNSKQKRLDVPSKKIRASFDEDQYNRWMLRSM